MTAQGASAFQQHALESIESIGVEEFLRKNARASVLRFSTAGSVDDGKSTLIGRLLHDSKNVYQDHLAALEVVSQKGQQSFEEALAYLTDGLKAEREQGITIDVAYRYFSTPKRHFILADTPGHEQYTRNMATGASTANLVLLLIDARNGVITQSKRHAFIASLLGIPRLLVVVNKMDLVDYSENVFDRIKDDFVEFAAKLGLKDLRFIPVSALLGDNIVRRSSKMNWYAGETIMEYLENVYIEGDLNFVDFRFPVQYILRPHQDYRGYAGQIVSGQISRGEEVTVLPAMKKSRVRSIDVFSVDPASGSLGQAHAPQSVAITLEDDIDIARGDMIVRSKNLPRIQNQFEAMVIWMSDQKMEPNRPLIIMHTTRQSRAFIEEIKYKVDVNTLSRREGTPFELNEIGRAVVTCTTPLLIDPYNKNRATGSFILADALNYQTVAAGMIIDRLPQELLPAGHNENERRTGHASANIHYEESAVALDERESKLGCKAATFWFTGLSGSGKSTIARRLERRLFELGGMIYRLDGDNIRFGLNRDLSFSKEDRAENIRRVAEVARLFNLAGVSVICSFISPFRDDREKAKEIIGAERFLEIHIDTPLEICEGRDPHGLYKKARAGEIREFTGISSPYEPPAEPALTIDTSACTVEECVDRLAGLFKKRAAGDRT